MATPRLKEKYVNEIVPALKEKFNYTSVMQVPKIEKICINKGMGVAVTDKKLIDQGVGRNYNHHGSEIGINKIKESDL